VPFLQGLGFVEIERERISAAVRSSWQFAEEGCSCATSLRLAL
jgi:N-acetylglutamate synthase-like GNAT family acetyltransferase